MQLFPKDMQGAGQAIQAASPLLMAMSQGLLSGQGAMAYAPQGLAAMMQQSKDREEKEQKKRDMGLLSGFMGGGPSVSTQGGGQTQRNTALQAYGGPTKQAADALDIDFGGYEKQYGLPEGYLSRTAQIESSMNPRAQNPNSSAGGLFQFIDGTAQQYGLADKMDPTASTDAAARLARDNAGTLRQALGRDPTAGELYLAHQQGGGGAAKLLANPNARAVDIVGADAVRLNGGSENMTAAEFASKWTGKFGGGGVMSAQGRPSGGMDQGRLMQILQSEHIDPAIKQMAMQRYQQANAQPDPMKALELERAQLQIAQMRNPERRIITGADGYQYYDDGQRVLPGVQRPEAGFDADRYRVVGGSLFDLGAEGGPQAVGQGQGQSETIYGPDGQVILERGPAGYTAGKLTESQAKDNVYTTRAKGAQDVLEPNASELTNRSMRILDEVPLGLGRGGQSQEYQVAQQAGQEFLQAILRKDTGAAITTEEQQLYGQTFLPQPGDGPAVLEAKRNSRYRAIEAIQSGMNPSQILATEQSIVRAQESADSARQQFNPPQQGEVVDGYTFMGGDPADPASWQR